MAQFTGFSPDGLRFLAALPRHNDREWFKANRAAFDDGIVEPGKLLCAALGEKLKALDEEIHVEPRIGGNIFRQHRDVRFSKDKSPYKTHFDLWFWAGDKKGSDVAGFYVRVTGGELWVGGGRYGFDKPALIAYRKAVGDDDRRAVELAKIAKKLTKDGFQVEGQHYKRVPKPWSADHPHAELLKHNSLTALMRMPLPPETEIAKLVPLLFRLHKKVAPLHHWLRGTFAGR